ncbi:MAG: hypothetical protein Q8880_11530, partial [Bacteroidota bacterium]|nr:hypothetical protein [Bacteroidota bacterium]
KEVIETKAEIILSDFVTKRLNWLSGAAKAMLITPSRKHAVLYKLMIDKMIAKNGYGFKSVVAFTGTVEHDGVKYTEENMNKDFKEKDIKQIISNNDNARIIVVADKLQTGFDEKLLCCLYIDKRLNSAVKAVQTISRINRPCKGKKTFVLDFINNPETIKEYFEYYYGGDIYLPLDNETDPNILFAKRDTLLDYFVFTLKQVQEAYNLINDGQKHSGLLTSIFAGAREKYKKLEADKQKLFLGELSKFSKLFYYISTVYNIWNEELKEVAVFADALYNVLYQKKDETSIDPEELVELVKFSTEKVKEEQDLFMSTTEEKLNKINTEVNLKQKKFSVIDEIIEAINTKYGTYEKSEEELTQIVDIVSKDEDMQKKTKNSSPNAYQAEAEEKIDKIIINRMLESDGERLDFYTNISNDKQVLKELAKVVIHKIKDMLIAG